LVYTDQEILESITCNKPTLTAIDAPLNLPRRGILRRAEKEMIKRGYKIFPLKLPAMEKLTIRAIKLNTLIAEKGYKTIEVHPTSTRKALNMPTKDWTRIQMILNSIGLGKDLKTRIQSSHEVDAVIAALTARLYLQGRTESVGNETGGYIIVPNKQDWRTLRI
jgi:predicted nuclease with RNAse H fold